MHGRPTGLAPCLCLLLPLPAPELPLLPQLLMVSLLSSQLLSCGQGLEEQGQGGSHWHAGMLGSHFDIYFSLRIQFGKGSEKN